MFIFRFNHSFRNLSIFFIATLHHNGDALSGNRRIFLFRNLEFMTKNGRQIRQAVSIISRRSPPWFSKTLCPAVLHRAGYCLVKSRMRPHRIHKLPGCKSVGKRRCQFPDHVRRSWTHHLRSQQHIAVLSK